MEIIVKKFNELTNKELYDILKVREEVFVLEQKCVYKDIDDKDLLAYHVYIKENDKIIAYLRVLDKNVSFPEVSIGRVLTKERNKGYGKIIVNEGIKVAKEKFNSNKIRIAAQLYAVGFYEKFGFKKVGKEFIDAGIPHIIMILDNETC